MHYCPAPYPDELFGSVLARALDHFGLTRKHSLKVKGFQGMPRFAGDPYRLNKFGYESKELISLIQQLCIFPALSPFLTLSVRRKHFLWARTGGHWSHAAGKRGRPPSPLRARLCPKCVEEDSKTHGEPYYHRSHQLAGLEICLHHKCYLVEAGTRYGREFDSARIAVDRWTDRDAIPADLSDSLIQSLSSNLKLLFAQPLDPGKDMNWRPFYRVAFNVGYGRRLGIINRALDGMFDRLGPQRDKIFRCDTWKAVSAAFLSSNPGAVSQPTIDHLLMLAHPGLSTDNLNPAEGSFWRCPNQPAPCYGTFTLNQPKIFSYGYILSCTQCGLEFMAPRTSKVGTIPNISKVIAAGDFLSKHVTGLHQKRVGIKSIAKETGFGKVFVRNLLVKLALVPRIRTQETFQDHYQKRVELARFQIGDWIKKNPTGSRTEINLACAVAYRLLKRMDPKWLEAKLPPPRSNTAKAREKKKHN